MKTVLVFPAVVIAILAVALFFAATKALQPAPDLGGLNPITGLVAGSDLGRVQKTVSDPNVLASPSPSPLPEN